MQNGIDVVRINSAQAAKHITMCFFTKLVPMLHGSPGIGKSNIYEQIAKRHNLKLIDLRLTQYEPPDLNGFPRINKDRAGYVPMDTFPLTGDDLPKGYKGWLILLDEINSAERMVQAASYKLTLDRMIGQFFLHDKVVIACAGNLVTDGAIVNKVGTAMQSRLVHYELRVEHKPWSLWASKNALAQEIISFINFKPANLHVFDPNHNDKTFPCPRTWEFASRIVKFKSSMSLEDKRPSLAGCVGIGAADEFITYCEVYKEIPTYKDIIRDPKYTSVPDEPSMLAAIAGMIGSSVGDNDMDKAVAYVNRLPKEYQAFTMRDAFQRLGKQVLKNDDFNEWFQHNAEELYV